MKKYLIIGLTVIVAAGVGYFYLARYYFDHEQEIKVYTAEDFPEALSFMSAEIRDTSIADLNIQYEKMAVDDHTYLRWINIGLLKKRLHDYSGAEQAWLSAVSYGPDQALAYGNLADFYLFDLSRYQEAERYYLKALELRPDNYGYYAGLAALYRYNMIEKADQIEQWMAKGAEANPAEAANYYMYLSDYFSRVKENSGGGDIVKARAYKRKTLELDPSLESQLPKI